MNEQSTILIVDDQKVMRDTIALLLGRENYDLRFAENGQAALTKAAQLPPDIILLDIMMPGLDGFEVCRRLRAHPVLATVPIVMVTALNDRASWVTGIEAGADDFVFKPFDTVELRTRVRNITQLNRYRRLVVEQMKFDWVIDQTDDGFVMLDEAGNITYANPRARFFLEMPTRGTSFETASFVELAQQHFQLEPKEAWQNWPNRPPHEMSRYLVRPETHTAKAFWLNLEVLNLPPGAGVAQVVRLRDVTKQMDLQQDMWRFQHMVFHKLRTPLAVSLSSVELLARHTDQITPDKVQQLSQRALGGMERLRDEINDVLQYMRAPALARPGEGFEMADLKSLIQKTCQELNIRRLQTAGLENLDHIRLPLTRRTVELIVWEILENAHKFHPQHNPLIQLFASQLKSGEVGIWLGDNGLTLSPEQLAQVWVPYYQGEKSFTGEVAGMGLGLSVVASLIWQVGGRCRMYNRQGEPGVVVEIVLPPADRGVATNSSVATPSVEEVPLES